jgi:hypothetical protein
MGARVVYFCLKELVARKAFGVIQDAILVGAPVTPGIEQWKAIASVVSGRLVNGYSRNDWTLGFLYRAVSVRVGVKIAGLQPSSEEVDGDVDEVTGKMERLDVDTEKEEQDEDELVLRQAQKAQSKIRRTDTPVEDVDLSHIIGGHFEYADKMDEVLRYIGVESLGGENEIKVMAKEE